MNPLVAADRYPVPVSMPSGESLSRARVVLTAPEPLADPPAEPRLLIATAAGSWLVDTPWDLAASWTGSQHVDWRIATGDGVYVVHPGRGCRCGRLGHWSPFDGPERRESLSKVMRRAREDQGAA